MAKEASKVRLSICRLNEDNEASVKMALSCLARAGLDETECSRLEGLRNDQAKMASIGARLALLWALTDRETALSIHGFDELPLVSDKLLTAFCRTEQGAPYLSNGTGAVSLAHSARLAVCAWSDDGGIGVDVEPLDRRIARAEDIAARYFSKGEQALLAKAPDRNLVFLRIWTRKEALGKALGTGLNADAEQLDTTAYPDSCFSEWTIEGEQISVCRLPHMAKETE
jgi:hypothetical protein